MNKKIAVLGASVIALVLFACSDDSSSQATDTESSSSSTIYSSSENLADSLTKTVETICDLPLCSDSTKDYTYFVVDRETHYKCGEGILPEYHGIPLTTAEYYSCHLREALRDTVESKAELPECSDALNGTIYLEKHDGIYACKNAEWAHVKEVVLTVADLSECNASNADSTKYVVSNASIYTCANEKWIALNNTDSNQ